MIAISAATRSTSATRDHDPRGGEQRRLRLGRLDVARADRGRGRAPRSSSVALVVDAARSGSSRIVRRLRVAARRRRAGRRRGRVVVDRGPRSRGRRVTRGAASASGSGARRPASPASARATSWPRRAGTGWRCSRRSDSRRARVSRRSRRARRVSSSAATIRSSASRARALGGLGLLVQLGDGALGGLGAGAQRRALALGLGQRAPRSRAARSRSVGLLGRAARRPAALVALAPRGVGRLLGALDALLAPRRSRARSSRAARSAAAAARPRRARRARSSAVGRDRGRLVEPVAQVVRLRARGGRSGPRRRRRLGRGQPDERAAAGRRARTRSGRRRAPSSAIANVADHGAVAARRTAGSSTPRPPRSTSRRTRAGAGARNRPSSSSDRDGALPARPRSAGARTPRSRPSTGLNGCVALRVGLVEQRAPAGSSAATASPDSVASARPAAAPVSRGGRGGVAPAPGRRSTAATRRRDSRAATLTVTRSAPRAAAPREHDERAGEREPRAGVDVGAPRDGRRLDDLDDDDERSSAPSGSSARAPSDADGAERRRRWRARRARAPASTRSSASNASQPVMPLPRNTASAPARTTRGTGRRGRAARRARRAAHVRRFSGTSAASRALSHSGAVRSRQCPGRRDYSRMTSPVSGSTRDCDGSPETRDGERALGALAAGEARLGLAVEAGGDAVGDLVRARPRPA